MELCKRLFKMSYRCQGIVIISLMFSGGMFAHTIIKVHESPWQLFPLTDSLVATNKRESPVDNNLSRKHTQFNRMRLNVL